MDAIGKVRRTAVAVAAFCLAAFGMGVRPVRADEEPLYELDPGTDSGRVLGVRVDSADLVTVVAQSWAYDYLWQGTRLTCAERAADGGIPFTWGVAEMGISGQGVLRSTAPNALQWRWDLTLAKDLPIRPESNAEDYARQPHGGLTFVLNLQSLARRGCTAEPVLRDDGTGWTWEVTPGRTVSVAFSRPLASLYFERGIKDQIRAMFYNAPMKPGKLDLTMTVTGPEGSKILRPMAERYAADTTNWFKRALDPQAAFVDLSYLNDKPAGKHGLVRAVGDSYAFEDGTPARFWGAAVSAAALYVHDKEGNPDTELIDRHARRLAQLGFNMVRMTHVDSWWFGTNLIAPGSTTDQIDDKGLASLFYWIKALKEQGIYVHVDMITYRPFKTGDNIPGFDEIRRHRPKGEDGALVEGFSYLNPRIKELWRKTSEAFVTRVNPYTGLALKDDPSVVGIMVWNENDLTFHFGNAFLADKNTPWHRAIFLEKLKAFAARTGLSERECETTWLPSPSKLFLNDLEYTWNRGAADFLRSCGVSAPICAGHMWSGPVAFCLPALTAGDVVDNHSYSPPEFLRTNPHYVTSFAHMIAVSQLADRPKFVSEYNMSPAGTNRDAFTTMPYVATLGAFQGWDMLSLFGYSQDDLVAEFPGPWTSYTHPQIMGLAPAAAVIFRKQHVSPARQTVFVPLTREQTYLQDTSPQACATLRTVMERHGLALGLPKVPELAWSETTPAPAGAEVVTDLDRDFIPPGDEVVADTGEFRRNWVKGTFVVDTPKSQLVMGSLDGETLRTADATFAIASPIAAVALTSLDEQSLKSSRRMLLSTSGRVLLQRGQPTLSEPVQGTVTLSSGVSGLRLVPLASDGSKMAAVALGKSGGSYAVEIPTDRGTHWFLLESE